MYIRDTIKRNNIFTEKMIKSNDFKNDIIPNGFDSIENDYLYKYSTLNKIELPPSLINIFDYVLYGTNLQK